MKGIYETLISDDDVEEFLASSAGDLAEVRKGPWPSSSPEILRFTDTLGQQCHVQVQSRGRFGSHLWVGIDGDRMLISRTDMQLLLLPRLERFCADGNVYLQNPITDGLDNTIESVLNMIQRGLDGGQLTRMELLLAKSILSKVEERRR